MRQAIKKIMSEVTDECVITSCGYISREVYREKDRPRNFYMVGSMGMALGLGLGLAYQRSDLKVIVISGDGAVLMSLGTSVLKSYLNLPNLKHYILDNDCYASTGGQRTCWRAIQYMPRSTEVIKVGYKSTTSRIPLTCKQIKERFENAILKH